MKGDHAMCNHVRGLVVGMLCGVALFAAGCSSGTGASSVTTRSAVAQADAYCQAFLHMETDLAPQGTPGQMSPSQAEGFFSRLDDYLAKAVSEAPPSLRSVTQSFADTERQIGQEVAAHGYNPAYNPPAEQELGAAEPRFLDTARPWMSVHCPAVLHPEASPGSSQLPAGGLHGTLPGPGSSGPAGQ
ncbi:MAG: hypothetical protein M0Z69_08090 [Actinomycetota bacterium]|nr:hypothetical protein [Actinomycetota bacterium]